MKVEVALIHEQGQDFAILAVRSSVLASRAQCEEVVAFSEREFGVRTALLAEDGRTWGPPDIVRWLKMSFSSSCPGVSFRSTS
jgi:hypothetical protein